jgi:AbrB family looped-hinge helix DNA binding protein
MQSSTDKFYREFETSVSAKGQITLPVYGRKRLGIEQNEKVKVRVFDDGTMQIIPKQRRSFLNHAGTIPSLKKPLTTREMREIMYEERAEEFIRNN